MSALATRAGRCFEAHDSRIPVRLNPVRLTFSASPWRAAGYLISYLAVSWLTFSVSLTAVTTAVALAWTVAALPLLIVAAGAVRWCANVERGLLGRVLVQRVESGRRPVSGPGLRARVAATWRDRATWRELAYLIGLWVPLYALDTAVIAIWGYFLSWITVPLWYWAPWVQYHGRRIHGYELGFYFPHGPRGPGTVGVFVDTVPKALLAAAVGAVGFMIFNYVLVATAGMHARVARSLLRPPADPLADAKKVLAEPGPLGRLSQASG